MRNFSKTLTLMGLLTPVGANALGVGEIKLHSALNQVLEAEIPLITSGSESASDIRVSLASPTAFARAGIERPHYLSRLRFKPTVVKGKVVVKVSSREVIREPFLNFLIEVNWPQGRMLREFTVLLDPPATFDESSITATRAPTVKSTTVTKPHYAVDKPSNYGFHSTSKSPKGTKPAASSKPAVSPKPKAQARYKSGDFVSSHRNDSLWGLAKRANNDPAISQEQMMVALYEANPHAFFKKNMNALKAGQRLKVPSRETVLKHSRSQALAEFARQNDEWNARTASTSEKKSTAPSSADKERIAEQTIAGSESNLEIVSPSVGETVAKSSSDLAKNASGGKSELAIEMVETVRQENDELRSRLKEAEEQLARMKLMLTLKDKQLSALQSKTTSGEVPTEKVVDLEAGNLDTQSPQIESAPGASTDDSVAPAEVAPVESTPNAEAPFTVISETAETSTSDQAVQTEEQAISAELQPESIPTMPEQPEVAENASEQAVAPTQPEFTEAKSKPETPEVPPVPAVSPEPADIAETTAQPEDDFLSELLSEPYYLAAGGGVVFLLGLIGWSLVRRRNRIIEAGAESILTPSGSDKSTVEPKADKKEVEAVQAADTAGVVESSFLSEFTPSDFDALEMEQDDVDPVSEADVYLAYGRYQQAEDLIRNAIETYPDRDECKLKLLEIHFATEDRDAFEAYAKELDSYKEEKPEFWAKVAEMGREICPSSALFARGETDDQTLSRSEFEETDFADDSSENFDLNNLEGATDEKDFEGDDLGFELTDNLDENDEQDDQTVSRNEFEETDFSSDDSEHFGLNNIEGGTDKKDFEGDGLGFDLTDNLDENNEQDDQTVSRNEFEETDFSNDDSEHFDLNNIEGETGKKDFEDDGLGSGLTANLNENDEQKEYSSDPGPHAEKEFNSNPDLNAEQASVAFSEEDNDTSDDNSIEFDSFDEEAALEDYVTEAELDEVDTELLEQSEQGADLDVSDTELLDESEQENVESFEFSNVDLGEPVDSVNEETDETSEFSDLTDMDEIETKLDLAKAYVDMDDQESARGILSEILVEGNDEQKTEARALVEGLENKA